MYTGYGCTISFVPRKKGENMKKIYAGMKLRYDKTYEDSGELTLQQIVKINGNHSRLNGQTGKIIKKNYFSNEFVQFVGSYEVAMTNGNSFIIMPDELEPYEEDHKTKVKQELLSLRSKIDEMLKDM